MKKASSVLYLIGNIINVIGIVVCVIFGLILVCGRNAITEVPEAYANQYTLEECKNLCSTYGVTMLIMAVVYLVVYIFAHRARVAVNNDTRELKPHIIMIVLAFLGQDIFYLIGGILGLVAETSENITEEE